MGLFLDGRPGVFLQFWKSYPGFLEGLPVMPGKKPGDWIEIMGQKLYDSTFVL